ncbi:hypothetical protein D3C80_1419260 [compost metagenome]
MVGIASIVALSDRIGFGHELQKVVARVELVQVAGVIRLTSIRTGIVIIALDLLVGLGQQLYLPGCLVILLCVDLGLGHQLIQRPVSDDWNYSIRSLDGPHLELRGVEARDTGLSCSRRRKSR